MLWFLWTTPGVNQLKESDMYVHITAACKKQFCTLVILLKK